MVETPARPHSLWMAIEVRSNEPIPQCVPGPSRNVARGNHSGELLSACRRSTPTDFSKKKRVPSA